MEGGGTEAFPDLGRHCQHSDCNQLDFLPFKCVGCHKFFCLDHRSYKSHHCPNSDHNSRKVVVCDICSASIETTGRVDDKSILDKHHESGDCDPNNNKKPKCPVRRCKGVLTFSNATTCKHCQVKVCLKHRFPADHSCKPKMSSSPSSASAFLAALSLRNRQDCGNKSRASTSPRPGPSVKSY